MVLALVIFALILQPDNYFNTTSGEIIGRNGISNTLNKNGRLDFSGLFQIMGNQHLE